MAHTESMGRDEILSAIEQASTVDNPDPQYVPDLMEVSDRMRRISRLADEYRETAYEIGYLAEALGDAMERFADMIRGER